MRVDDTARAWLPATPGNYASQNAADTPPGFDLAAFWRLLTRHFWLIIVTVIVLTGASAATIWTLPQRYNAEALLLVREHQPTLLDIQNAVRGNETETSDSEIEIIRSRRIAKQVVKKLDLTHEPSVNPELQPEGWAGRLRREIGAVIDPVFAPLTAWLSSNQAQKRSISAPVLASLAKPSQEDIALTRTADAVIKNLTVAAKGRSRAVGVTFEATDPRLAAAVANAVVDSYVADQLDAKLLASAQANEWLSERVAEIRAQVVSADRQLQQRKVAAGITDGRQVDLIKEQISSLSEQMIVAHAETIKAESRLQQAEHTRTLDSIAEILNSPVIQKLREDQADLQRRLTAARQMFGDRYPPVIKLQAEFTDLTSSIRHEVEKIMSALRSDVGAMQVREQMLRQSLEDLRAQSAQIGATDVEIAVQQREADANRALFDRILSRAKETSVESGLQQPDAQVIAHADVPEKASFPNKPLFIAVAFLASLAAAALIVVSVESLDHGFHDLEEAETMLGLPALGFLPRLARRGVPAPQLYAVQRPHSAYAEALRGLYASLILSDPGQPPKTVLVTSSLPGEGKTSVSVALARLIALSGRKVILIDCDLRRRDVSRMLGIPAAPGLVDHLFGDITLAQATTRDEVSGAYLLPAGIRPANPTDLLSSEKMRDLLMVLSATFDLIIIDSAPVLVVSDTRSLCRLADRVVMAVRWQHTRKAAVAVALRQIVASGGNLVGILLTLADTKRVGVYNASNYYFGQAQRYLTH